MRRLIPLLAAASVASMYAACSDAGNVTRPEPTSAAASRAGTSKADDGVRRIEMFDACDPASFNAVLGAGACVRSGGVTFAKFIDQVTKHGSAGAWHFAPPIVQARVGQTLLAINRGGEEHTFTEVEEFGGGFVQALNDASGNPVPAPECLSPAVEIVPAGGTTTDDVEEAGTEKYQCCIHPWMRTTVNARE